eukprot:COSAG01_NODE_1001_length_12210_cov_60.505491_13_plen_116_part_00
MIAMFWAILGSSSPCAADLSRCSVSASRGAGQAQHAGAPRTDQAWRASLASHAHRDRTCGRGARLLPLPPGLAELSLSQRPHAPSSPPLLCNERESEGEGGRERERERERSGERT